MENFYILDLPLKYLFLPRNNNNIRYIDYVYESIKKYGLKYFIHKINI